MNRKFDQSSGLLLGTYLHNVVRICTVISLVDSLMFSEQVTFCSIYRRFHWICDFRKVRLFQNFPAPSFSWKRLYYSETLRSSSQLSCHVLQMLCTRFTCTYFLVSHKTARWFYAVSSDYSFFDKRRENIYIYIYNSRYIFATAVTTVLKLQSAN
jgi:hypothetical protein